MTTSPFLFLMAILSGACIFTGFNSLLLGWRESTKRIHVSFAIMSLLVGGFVIAQVFAYEANSSAELIQRRRLDLSLAILIFIAFTWFIHFYTAWSDKRAAWGLTAVFAMLVFLNWLFPYGLAYPDTPVLNRFTLPWGEVVTDIGSKDKSAWYYLAWSALLASFIFLFVACRRLYQLGTRGRARILMYSAGVFLAFVLSNNLMNYRVVQFVYLAPFGFIALIIMMGVYFNWEHQRITRLLHASESRYAAIIASSVDGIILTDKEQRIQEFNAAAEHLFGYRAAELTGKPIDCLFAEGPRWGYQQQLRDITADRANLPALQCFGRINGLRADGWEFPVDASFSQVALHGQQFVSAIVRDASESQKDKEAVRVSAERYRALVRNIPGMVYRAAMVAPWCLQFVSEGVEIISGQPASYYFGEHAGQWLERVLAEDRAIVAAAFTRLVTQRQPVEFSYRIRHRDNSIRWVQDRAQLVSNALGQPVWIDGLVLDITQQKAAESSLAQAYSQLETQVQERTRELSHIINRFNEAQQVANLGSWELNLVTNQLEWSDEIFRIFTIDKDKFGASYEAFLHAIHPEDRDRVNHAYTDAVANQRPYDIVHRLLLSDAQIKYVHERAVTEYDPQGKPLRSLGTVQDVTGRVLIENQLRETTALLNSIIDNLPNMIFLKHAADLRFALLNKAGEELLGVSRHDLIGKNDFDFFPKVQAELFTAKDRAVLAQTGLVDFPEEPIDTLRQGRRILHTKKVALRDESGVPRYLLGIAQDITAKIETEKQLRRQAQVIDQIHDSVVATDLRGNVTSWNQGAVNLFGLSAAEMLGQPISRVYPPDQHRILFEEVIAPLQQQGEHETEVIMQRRNGERFYAHLSLSMLHDEQGAAYGMIGYAIDISATKQVEQSLQRINAELESHVRERTRELDDARQFNAAVVDTVGALVVVLERSGQIILFNHACELTSGYGSEEVLGKYVWDFLLRPEQCQPVKEVFAKLTASDFPSEYENDWLHRGGTPRRIAWSNTCLTDAQGKVEFVIGTGVDITERKRVEKDLRDSEELFRQLAENVREVFFVRDTYTNTMIYVSPAYESLFNQPRESLYSNSRAFVERVHPEDLAGVMAALQAQREHQQYFNREYRIVPRPGEVRWLWVRSFPVRDITGQVYRLAGLVEDITERRMAEESRLAQARIQRDVLVREVHHRIKNNLQGIVGLLRQHVAAEPALKPSADSAITQISAMAQVHGLQGEVQGERIKLCDLTRAIAANIAGLIGVAIQPIVERATLGYILVAEDEAVPIALIINELLFNAAKHSRTAEQAPIHVHIDCHDAAIWLHIRSQGKPLPAGFDLQQGQGLGTGLMLVKALLPENCQVDLHAAGEEILTILKLVAPAVTLPPECV